MEMGFPVVGQVPDERRYRSGRRPLVGRFACILSTSLVRTEVILARLVRPIHNARFEVERGLEQMRRSIVGWSSIG